MDTKPKREQVVEFGDRRFVTPVRWTDVASFGGLFPASLDAIRDILPSADLHPVLSPRGEALVWVLASRQPLFAVLLDDGQPVLSAPLAACTVATPVTFGKAARRWTLMSLGRSADGAGLFELHLPVTTVPGRDVGRALWGEPKFLADFDLSWDRDANPNVTVSESGRTILELHAQRPGTLRPYIGETSFYCATEDTLFRWIYRSTGHRHLSMIPGRATVTLGTHQVADEIRALGLKSRSVIAFTMRSTFDTQYAATTVGPAHRVNAPFEGPDMAHGYLHANIPGLGEIDLYAGVPEEQLALSIPAGVMESAQ